MGAVDDLDVRFQRVESRIDALGDSVDEMSADHRDHTAFTVERLGIELRARFDAVDGRLHAVDGRLDAVDGRLDALGSRLERVEARFDGVEARLDTVDARFGTVLARFDGSDARLETMDVRFARLERKVDRILDHLLPGPPPDTKRRP